MDTETQAIAANFGIKDKYAVGFGVNIFDPGTINGYSADDEKTGNINAGDYSIRVGLSTRGDISYGALLSYFRQRLSSEIGSGYGFGFGVTYNYFPARISLSADNIGPNFKIGNSQAPLPARVSLSGWIPLQSQFTNLNIDLTYSRAYGYRISGGAEYSPVKNFFLRAGSGTATPISAGLGLGFLNFQFDYAFVPSTHFGDRHIFSLSTTR
jgi:hypothetical protein